MTNIMKYIEQSWPESDIYISMLLIERGEKIIHFISRIQKVFHRLSIANSLSDMQS